MQLRDYQLEMMDRLERAWTRHRSVLVQMPTGTGKTVLMAEVIRRQTGDDCRHGILIVAHRRELLEQIRRTVGRFGIDTGRHRIVVESIQKLAKGNGPEGLEPGLVIIDEAHHALARTYRTLWDRWPGARFLGLTATPCRMSHAGFLDLFQTMVRSHSIQEFIKRGWLSDFDYVTAEPDNPIVKRVAGLTRRGPDGDYQTREMALVLDSEESVESLYRAYRKFADGKRGIVYAIDRGHARHITEYYLRMGVNCRWIEAATPAGERDRMVQEYRDGRIDVVVNVDILGEGADFPEVEFIQLARPTLSLSKYLQQVGRGMRIAHGKDRVVILDHVGMYQAFGLPTEDWDWQRMFEGKLAGRAGIGRQALLYVRADGHDRELADVRMVRIRQKGGEHRGLEVFMQDGLYGIAMDGRVIHQPLFMRVRRADDGFFAYCTYPYMVYRNRVTIIDNEGRDLGLKMYGNMEWEDRSLLRGTDGEGRPVWWDREYDTYYHERPVFERVGGIGMARLKAGYVLRKFPDLIKPTQIRDIYYNQKIIWMNDWLISKHGQEGEGSYSPRRIISYGNRSFYVKTESARLPGVTIIDTSGNFVERRWKVPNEDDHRTPLWRQTTLTNAYTHKEGFYHK